ncbi:MAG: flagella assembly protein FlgT middle domain-containing protein [Thermoanaerobaculia bacterium]
MKRAVAVAIALLAPVSVFAGVFEATLTLPVRPRFAISEGTHVAIAPFVIVVAAEDRADRASKVDVQSEFSRYLKKKLEKETKLEIIDASSEDLPTSDTKELAANRDFWKSVAAKSGADYVMSGSIDFDIEDKAGYKTEEYTSPVDGRTYYRQVLVESTGFVFDIVFVVFDGDTGEKVAEENFRDFKQFDGRNYDELMGLFENLRSMEKQILSMFISQETTSTRYLFD